MTDNIELQLLVIMMGNDSVFHTEACTPYYRSLLQELGRPSRQTETWISQRSFADIRAAVDALDEEDPPEPRIERQDNKTYPYRLRNWFGCWVPVSTATYDALSQLAGKPLPIWTPKKGVWTEIVRSGEYNPLTNTNSIGVSIWRYTRRGE